MEKEWEVRIYEMFAHSTTVEAANEDEAYEKAYKIIANGPKGGYDTEVVGFTGMWDAYEC